MSLVLLISSARNDAQYQQLQQQQQLLLQHQQQYHNQFQRTPIDGYSLEEREWITGRDFECLLFMLISLMDCVCEPSTPPSSLPCPSTSSSFLSPSHRPTHGRSSSDTIHQTAPHPHPLPGSSLNFFESKSSSTFRTANSRPLFPSQKTENSDSTPQRSWFNDITYVTYQFLEHETVQDEIFRKHPAVGIRLLQLWIVMPSPKGIILDVTSK